MGPTFLETPGLECMDSQLAYMPLLSQYLNKTNVHIGKHAVLLVWCHMIGESNIRAPVLLKYNCAFYLFSQVV